MKKVPIKWNCLDYRSARNTGRSWSFEDRKYGREMSQWAFRWIKGMV